MRPRIAFLGSPEFAVPSLSVAHHIGQVEWVLTQPDRPAGRGRRTEATAVRSAAEALGLRVDVYERKNRRQIDEQLAKLQLDVLVVVAFGHILKPSTLSTSRRGAVNVHASLLPRWRGASPIERALAAGDAVTGITLMQLDEGMDTGPIWAQQILSIDAADNRDSLSRRLAQTGARLLEEKLVPYLVGEIRPTPQAAAGITQAPMLEKSEGELDWRRGPVELWNQVRAFFGWPGAFTRLGDRILKVHRVLPVDLLPQDEPGTIVQAQAKSGVHVACGTGTLELLEVQLPGKAACAATQLVHGRILQRGLRFSHGGLPSGTSSSG